jgi:glycosyltransferase involved in cell wall biosynthesis
MISVLFFCPFPNNAKSGVQRYAREIIDGTRLTPIKTYEIFWNKDKGYLLSYLVTLIKFVLVLSKVDIVQFVVLSPYNLPFMLITRIKKKVSITTYHGLYTRELSKSGRPFQYLLFSLTDRLCRRISDQIISLNLYLIRELRIKKNYQIIPNPFQMEFDLGCINPGNPKINEVLLITATNFNIPAKAEGLDLLLKSIESSLPSFKNIKLLVFGHGKQLLKIRKKYEHIKNVEFMGFKPNIREYLQRSNAYIHISGLDTQPFTVIEALMMKKIILCNNLDSLIEMLPPGNNYIVEYNLKSISDGLKRLINDIMNNQPDLIERGKVNGLFARSRYSSKVVVGQYYRLYKDLLNRQISH